MVLLNQAFESLKKALISYPVLRQPDFNILFLIYTYGSGYGFGVILAQKDNENKEYLCAYASKTMRGAENYYGITEKKCLAVIWAIKQFRVYVYGTRFKAITDHSALCGL